MQSQNSKQPSARVTSTSQPQKSSSAGTSKQLRILDYRNGKYQGLTSQDSSFVKDGLGILIDDNYSFVLSEWKQNQIQGPFFMVYPDQSILYGFIQNKGIGEFVCHEVNKQFNMILSKNTNIILVDLVPSNSILVFKVDNKFLDSHTLDDIFKRKEELAANQQINKGFELLSQEEYANSEEKYKIYQKKLSLSNLPEYLKNYELFIHQKFNSSPQKSQLIEILRTREDLSINFKNSAITLFIKLYLQTNQTKMVGSMNRYENEYEFYRKSMHNSNTVEEFVAKQKNPFKTEYNLRPCIRPKQCLIQLCNFHRGAVTNVNQFININYMNHIKANFEKIHQLIKIFVTNRFAQVQLENSRYEFKEQEPNNETQISYTLGEVQQQIYQAVKRKKQSTGKKAYNVLTPSRITEYPATTYKQSNEKYSKSQTKKQQVAVVVGKNTNSPYIRALFGDDEIVESRLNRSKSYMNVSNVSKNTQVKATPTKNTPNKPVNQYNASGKKFAYLDEMENESITLPRKARSPPKFQGFQNMKRLTEDYENIQRQIELLPQDRLNRTPSRLDNSVYRKSTVRLNEYDHYNQPSATKNAALSQKKVFKYLPM